MTLATAQAGPVEDAQKLLRGGKMAEAQSLLEGYLSEQPGDRVARYLLANVYAQAGRMEQTYAFYQALVKEAPDDPISKDIQRLFRERGATAADAKRIEGLFGQVQQAMQRRDQARAISLLSEVLKLAPLSRPALHNLSQMLEQSRRFAEALPHVEQLAKLQPGDITTQLRLAGLYERLDRKSEAKQVYERILKRQPKNVVALFSLGRLAMFTDKNYAQAADYLARALKVDPKRPDLAYLLGVALNESGKVGEARKAFERSVAIDDRYYQSHFELALMDEAAGKDQPALARFAKVAQYGGNSAQAEQARRRLSLFGGDARLASTVKNLINEGITRLNEGNLEAAKAAFKEVIGLVPANTLALYNLATVYTREGANEQAIEALNQALEGDPTHFLSYFGLALIHVGAGRFEEAYEAYKQVVKWSPPDNPYHVEAASKVKAVEAILAQYQTKLGARKAFLDGNKLATAGDFEGAAAAYEEAIAQDEENPFYHYNAGVAYIELNRLGDAFKAFRRALELKPDHIQSHFRLALFYMATGFPQSAVKSFEEVIRYGTTEAEVAEAKSRLPEALAQADVKEKALAYLIIANAQGAELQNEQGALIALEHAYQLNPRAKEVASRYAELLMQLRREDEARLMLEPLLEKNSKDVRILWDLGQIYTTQKKWLKAEETLSRLLEVKEDFSQAASMLADVQERSGNIETAVATLKKHLESNPGDTQAMINLIGMLQRRKRDADAANLIDWYLSTHEETAQLLYLRGRLAKKLGGVSKEESEIQTDASALSLTATDTVEAEMGIEPKYRTANEWFTRVLEVAGPKDQQWRKLAQREIATSRRWSLNLSQTVMDFNSNANNSSTDPKAGVSSQVQLSATYTVLRLRRFTLPITAVTRHRLHYTFQTYVNTNTLRARLPSRLPLFMVTPDYSYSAVRTQIGPSSVTKLASVSVAWRYKFPSRLNGQYQYTQFESKTNANNNYLQERITGTLGQDVRLGGRFKFNVGVNYDQSVRDVVALFRDTEQTQLRYDVGMQITLPKRNAIGIRVLYSQREDIRGTNRRGDSAVLQPIIPIDVTVRSLQLDWWFQVYPNVRAKAFGSIGVTDLENVVQNSLAPDGSPLTTVANQQESSLGFGVEFTYRPDSTINWTLSIRQDERQASIDIPIDVNDLLTDQVIADNINKQQRVLVRMNYTF